MNPADAESPESDIRLRHSGSFGPTEAISFQEWNEVFSAAPETEAQRWAYRRAIGAFLKHCKESHCPATIMVIKAYLDGVKRTGGPVTETTDALRIQGVDLNRGPMILRSATRDKDRRRLLPESLREPLRNNVVETADHTDVRG